MNSNIPTNSDHSSAAIAAASGSTARSEHSSHEPLPSLEQLKEWFARSDDVSLVEIKSEATMDNPSPHADKNESADGHFSHQVLVFCGSMTDSKLLHEVILPQSRSGLSAQPTFKMAESSTSTVGAWQELRLPRPLVNRPQMTWHQYMVRLIFEGNAVLIHDDQNKAWSISSGAVPGRDPSEAATEVSVRGPKDGFVEQMQVNSALIRYRLRSPGLCCEEYSIGSHSATKVALMYDGDIADPQLVNRIRDRLLKIDAEDILSTRHLEDLLANKPWSLLPRSTYTGRPDFAVQCLNSGRVVILLDGSPTAIIAPVNLFLLMKSAEDAQQSYIFVNFSRMLRYISLVISCFLPGLYVALSVFHVDQIPFSLLATILNSRRGLPLNMEQEMFLVLLLIEIFREAGARLPGSIGQTLTVVGGLVIGDAAVRAGLISPTMIVISAMTFVAGSTLVNQSLIGAVTLVRFYTFFVCSQLGIFGFMLAVISVLVYVTRIESFGVPYLAPLAPLQIKDIPSGLFIETFRKTPKKPKALHPQEPLK
ncbi:spore germination protein [Paenibacillus herberti]|uniref:Spore germination protein n=1 Tax=Paenibacillus herberti TaxID=1619309 RepID=A0A229NVK7_9BACL|nr:spore germination protein [Paenibacillus herberti]OXM13956.1 spore germination protein [Paenibacillus herberti]